jgi:drug/metabolite transporter (DMT)-like permease
MSSPKSSISESGPLAVALTCCTALVAFAANSVLCRLALGGGAIDAASFTTVRLGSGAFTLFILYRLTAGDTRASSHGSWFAALMLFGYAVTFSFAYLSLTTATGALVLFGMVQLTMVLGALYTGERPTILEWAGLGIAVMGLVYLMRPGLSAPPLFGALLMGLAGIAWGAYSLRGRGSNAPLGDTAMNFVRALPFAVVVSLIWLPSAHFTTPGVLLAGASGAVASGCGYAIWYKALRGLTATRAAAIQLSVPLIAALGGVVFMGEILSSRLVLAAALILGGVGLNIFGRARS